MNLCEFLQDLFEGRRTRAAAPYDLSESELQETREFLANFEEAYRLNLPDAPPRFDVEAALWATTHYYKACQYALFRDYGPDFAFTPANQAIAALNSPEAHYSVDLAFRFLPDLLSFCRSATDDPLRQELLEWARQWPLSSVGIIEAPEVDIAPLLGSASLMQMYADRAIESGDVRAMQSVQGAQAIEESLGLYQELAPELMRQLALNAIPSEDEQAGNGE
ncbi:hypothetical protein [Lacipirellula parvula]|uniref:MoxR-vWA-beta-propeller ternary system domain-containing protein n=1 Tax=Lacipirellula parvula TaxID=2650471 RepID=A0A5K7XHC4_9BACT|nr:hypothetical protein [Lacipirellula parvula]BBO34351.1 hypothetical protein PLANPX_3963 [Lacipirellula parvula]